jgi:hypothetical protein
MVSQSYYSKMNVYNYYNQRNNVNLFIYIALQVSTSSNRSSSAAASFLHTVTKLQR